MIRELKARAQQLFWTAHELEDSEGLEAAKAGYAELASLHQQLAEERFKVEDRGAWIDALAAVTYLGKSGQPAEARDLLDEYRERAEREGLEEVCLELDSLEAWLAESHGPRGPGGADTERAWIEGPERVALFWFQVEMNAA